MVIPKDLREKLGLTPGIVEVEVRGSGLTITPITDDTLATEGDLLVIPGQGLSISDQDVRNLKDADQR